MLGKMQPCGEAYIPMTAFRSGTKKRVIAVASSSAVEREQQWWSGRRVASHAVEVGCSNNDNALPDPASLGPVGGSRPT